MFVARHFVGFVAYRKRHKFEVVGVVGRVVGKPLFVAFLRVHHGEVARQAKQFVGMHVGDVQHVERFCRHVGGVVDRRPVSAYNHVGGDIGKFFHGFFVSDGAHHFHKEVCHDRSAEKLQRIGHGVAVAHVFVEVFHRFGKHLFVIRHCSAGIFVKVVADDFHTISVFLFKGIADGFFRHNVTKSCFDKRKQNLDFCHFFSLCAVVCCRSATLQVWQSVFGAVVFDDIVP